MKNFEDADQDGPLAPSPHAGMTVPSCAADVINRMKAELNVKTDTQLGKIIGKSSKTIHSWRIRNSIPYESALLVAINYNRSLDYLLLGKHRDINKSQTCILDSAILRSKILNFLKDRTIGLSEDIVPLLAIELAMIIARYYDNDQHMMNILVDGGYMTREEFLRLLEEYGSIAKYNEFVDRHNSVKKPR